MATIAAALDERIDGVLAGSTGVGGTLPFRLAGERNHAESVESTTRMFPDWFHPRLRFFSGRDDRLPVDGNLLVALVAPRACLIHFNRNDEVGNTFGNEAAFRNLQELYKSLGAPDNIGMLRQPGFHSSGMDFNAGLDFLDIVFGRSTAKWENQTLFDWDWEAWREHHGRKLNVDALPDRSQAKLLEGERGAIETTDAWEEKAETVRKAVRSVIGNPPLKLGLPVARAAGSRGLRRDGGDPQGPNPAQLGPDVDAWVIQRGSGEFGWTWEFNALVKPRTIRFGDVSGELYLPTSAPSDTKLPTIIFLHSYSYPLGYMWVYRRDMHPVLALAKAGYAVLAFDQTGFGSRMDEWEPFPHRYPNWSRMGRMVLDVSAAVDALQADRQVEPQRIYLFGYGLGGDVALHAAALDPDIAGVVCIAGFTPMRGNTVNTGTGGLARNSKFENLSPRLGLFVGNEGKLPYDYDELIAAIAPRPVMVVSPQLARDANPADVRKAVEAARLVYRLYDEEVQLTLDEPWDYTRLPAPTQKRAIDWLNRVSNHVSSLDN
jgi:pimeloyl-ACP methyl ester carboxylesterase